jgi:hypothetical protein
VNAMAAESDNIPMNPIIKMMAWFFLFLLLVSLFCLAATFIYGDHDAALWEMMLVAFAWTFGISMGGIAIIVMLQAIVASVQYLRRLKRRRAALGSGQ